MNRQGVVIAAGQLLINHKGTSRRLVVKWASESAFLNGFIVEALDKPPEGL